jgi:prepilin-type N-terminal cleavage/methylation domain-containing protein
MEMNNKPLPYQRPLKHNRGFSLPEIIISLAIATLTIFVITEFMIETNRFQQFISDQSQAIAQADSASQIMTKALRETTDGADGRYAILTAAANSLSFYSDIDDDDLTEQVTYTISGTTLQQTIIEPTGTPADYLPEDAVTKTIAFGVVNVTYTNNAVFTYYDDNNVELTYPITLANVMLIKIHLDINANVDRIPDTHTIETYAQLRNLNDNL